MKQALAYGTWPSPVSAAAVAAAGRKLGQTALDQGRCYWVERRPEEGGRSTVVAAADDGAPATLVPSPYDLRSAVHEYGGGAFAVNAGRLWFVNGGDAAVYRREPDGGIHRVTAADSGLAFADLQVDAARGRLIAVCEDYRGSGEPAASLVAVAADGGITTLAAGRDFYASPRLSPAGDRLVWLAWDHPDMPWDGCELWQLSLSGEGAPSQPRRLAGGRGESLFQPQFAPDGALHVVSDAGGWWNICRVEAGGLAPVCVEAAEYGLPQWVFGQSTYGFDDDGRLYALRGRAGTWSLRRIARDGGAADTFDLPFTHLEQLRVQAGRLLFIGGAAGIPKSVCRLQVNGSGLERLRASSDADWDEAGLSAPEAIRFASGDAEAHALYYPPCHAEIRGPRGAAPPLLIKCHGGPTGATETALDPRIQFWTSRGFAVLDVNYRGSTGYGRAYREALYGAWGVADVADCVAAARYLVARGLADPGRVVVSGSSAGGYTVLCVLSFADIAAAGASYYGIADLARLAASTHKFESRYVRRLIGDDASLMRARSPLFNADGLACPVLFLQGGRDKVVPPDQAEAMVAAMRRRGLPAAHVVYPQERHGFAAGENIAHAIASELAFYGQVLGFEPTGELPAVRWSKSSPAGGR